MHYDRGIARNSESIPVSPAARPVFNRLAALTRQQLAAAQLLAALRAVVTQLTPQSAPTSPAAAPASTRAA